MVSIVQVIHSTRIGGTRPNKRSSRHVPLLNGEGRVLSCPKDHPPSRPRLWDGGLFLPEHPPHPWLINQDRRPARTPRPGGLPSVSTDHVSGSNGRTDSPFTLGRRQCFRVVSLEKDLGIVSVYLLLFERTDPALSVRPGRLKRGFLFNDYFWLDCTNSCSFTLWEKV